MRHPSPNLNQTHKRKMSASCVLKRAILAAIALIVCSALALAARGQNPSDATAAYAPSALKIPVVSGPEIWKDPSQPLDARVKDLVSRLSLVEKVSQISCVPAAIPRLGIPAYSHRNECLHGVLGGVATVFPQAIGMAATWDTPLIHEEADTNATEARARSNDYAAKHAGDLATHFGLSYYSPNINIFRDPRWGRGQETYGEDPFLTGQFAIAFISGLQGDNPKYVKIMACAKHYAVHSGPEPERHRLDVRPSERDLYETYLPAFEAAVREGHVGSVMGAYSALYGAPDCANKFLLTDLLRKQWGFNGFVVSDGGAIGDIWGAHKYAITPEEAAADAVNAGCDVASGNVRPRRGEPGRANNRPAAARGWLRGGDAFEVLPQAVQQGLISESAIDTAVSRELTARFRLGLFDPPSMVPWSKITMAQNNTPDHQALALKVAEESIVLLKNNGILPLNRAHIRRIAVIGPNADSVRMLLGNYHGTPSNPITILDGIKAAAGPTVQVNYAPGSPLALKNDNSNRPAPAMTAAAVAAARAADVVIYVGGIDSSLEKEQGRVNFQGFLGGDRTRIELPPVQENLLKALYAAGKPVIDVNCSGSAIAMPWEARHLPAIVQAWYPGEEGGKAVAEALFGEVNPSGRLPITFYRSTRDLPPFDDYSMSNRTYRYFKGRPLFAFGSGLSYTRFHYAGGKLNAAAFGPGSTVKLSFVVQNIGKRDGDEVAQVYFRHLHSRVPQPLLSLCGFTRVHLSAGQSTQVEIDIPVERFRYWDTAIKQYVVEPGDYQLLVGGASNAIRLRVPLRVR